MSESSGFGWASHRRVGVCRGRTTTKHAVTMLIATAIAVAFIAAVIVGSLGASSQSHMMPGGQTMTGGSMTPP